MATRTHFYIPLNMVDSFKFLCHLINIARQPLWLLKDYYTNKVSFLFQFYHQLARWKKNQSRLLPKQFVTSVTQSMNAMLVTLMLIHWVTTRG